MYIVKGAAKVCIRVSRDGGARLDLRAPTLIVCLDEALPRDSGPLGEVQMVGPRFCLGKGLANQQISLRLNIADIVSSRLNLYVCNLSGLQGNFKG